MNLHNFNYIKIKIHDWSWLVLIKYLTGKTKTIPIVRTVVLHLHAFKHPLNFFFFFIDSWILINMKMFKLVKTVTFHV